MILAIQRFACRNLGYHLLGQSRLFIVGDRTSQLNAVQTDRAYVGHMESSTDLIRVMQNVNVPLAEREAAFATLVTGFYDTVFRQAFLLLGDTALAEDAVQEAFLTAYGRISQLHDPNAFPGWLRRIVRTSCHRLIRRKQHPTLPLDEMPEHPALAPNPANTVEQREEMAILVSAVRTLPEADRTLLFLFYFRGYSIQEISVRLDCPPTTVKKRLQYARQRLRKVVAQRVDEVEEHPSFVIGRLPRQLRFGLLADALAEDEQTGIDEALRLEGITDCDGGGWDQDGYRRRLNRFASDLACDLLVADGWDVATLDAGGLSLFTLVEQRGSVTQRRLLQRYLGVNRVPSRKLSRRRGEG